MILIVAQSRILLSLKREGIHAQGCMGCHWERVSSTLHVANPYSQTFSVGVQSVLIEMQKALERGEVPEEELKALESDVTGKVCHKYNWRTTADGLRSSWPAGVVRAWK